MGYLPQELAADMLKLYGGNTWAVMKELFKARIPMFSNVIDEWNQKDFENFVLSENFLNPKYKGEFSALNSHLIFLNADKLENIKDRKQIVTIITDSKDLVATPIFISDWAEHKNVYKPDKDFVDMLISTPKFQLHIDQLRSLPYQDLCFDFSACPDLYPIEMAIVSFRFIGDSVFIVNYLMNKDMGVFSFYYGAKVEAGYIDLSKMSMENMLPADREYLITSEFSFHKGEKNYQYKYTRREIANIILQLIGYITCQNAEVKQSYQSKQTYKKHPAAYKPKADISEFKEYEIGVKIGKAIRKYNEQNGSADTSSDVKSDGNKSVPHKSSQKSPHIRDAHWHHYWTGEGRTKLIVKWLPPTFVNKDKPAKDIVIHKVKK